MSHLRRFTARLEAVTARIVFSPPSSCFRLKVQDLTLEDWTSGMMEPSDRRRPRVKRGVLSRQVASSGMAAMDLGSCCFKTTVSLPVYILEAEASDSSSLECILPRQAGQGQRTDGLGKSCPKSLGQHSSYTRTP